MLIITMLTQQHCSMPQSSAGNPAYAGSTKAGQSTVLTVHQLLAALVRVSHRVHPGLLHPRQCSGVAGVHCADELADGVAAGPKVLQQRKLQVRDSTAQKEMAAGHRDNCHIQSAAPMCRLEVLQLLLGTPLVFALSLLNHWVQLQTGYDYASAADMRAQSTPAEKTAREGQHSSRIGG
jgi:hypothetical protein